MESVNTPISPVHLRCVVLGLGGSCVSKLTGQYLPTHTALQSSSLGTLHISPSDCYDAGSHQQHKISARPPKGGASPLHAFTLMCLLKSVNCIHFFTAAGENARARAELCWGCEGGSKRLCWQHPREASGEGR